ncbi:MAG: bifunctional nuclease family protein [Bdellovibrionaceae bacterium]|nr:bifunctional nuclease family protein [Pseudobdellovibrionaceae bacterium]
MNWKGKIRKLSSGESGLVPAHPISIGAFVAGSDEEEVFHQDDLLQLQPFGLSFNVDGSRPFLLLRDASGQHTLPVPVHPIEAGLTMGQANRNIVPSSPHSVLRQLLASLGMTIRQCVFVQIKGLHQYVRLYLSGHPGTNSIKVRADEAMSICLQFGVPIFATKAFILRSRQMSADIDGLMQLQRTRPIVKNRMQDYYN